MPGGRPTDYTPDIGDRICACIANGHSATEACRQEGISRTAMYSWLRQHKEFADNYARAREDASDALIDDMREIERTEGDVQRAKLMCDNRKWAAARMSPRKWGDRQQVEHTGPGVVSGDAMKPEDWASQYADKGAEGDSEHVH